jgi:DNA-binding beta-propeller fold protein YncE
MLWTAAGAVAATDLSQKVGTAGCIAETASSGQCQDGRGLVGSASIVLSPDGRNAYVASPSWDSVSILSRDQATGALSPIVSSDGCLDSATFLYPDCTSARELGGADDVAISPDGRNVYVSAPTDSAIVIFDRDPLTGLLTLSGTTSGCVNGDGSNSCAEGRALDGVNSVTISPDGENAYVSSTGTSGIAIFDRDPNTGYLTQKNNAAGCINTTGAEGCQTGSPALLDPDDIEISPDGKNAYVTSRVNSAVTIYDRAGDGQLTPAPGLRGCTDEAGDYGCRNGMALIEPTAVAFNPSGENVYVAAARSDAIATFDRNPANGELTQKPGTAGCVSYTGASNPMQAGTAGDCERGRALDGVDSVAVRGDGNALYASAGTSDGVVVFERHPDGTLSQRPDSEGCVTDSGFEDPGLSWTAGFCQDGSALISANRVIASADSRFVYTTAKEGGVGIFDVVDPPQPPGPRPATEPPVPNPACISAQDEARLARRNLAREEKKVRHLAYQVPGEKGDRGRRALTKHRHQVKLWKKRLRLAKGNIESRCTAN